MKPSEADMDAKPRLHAKAGHHDRARAHAPARLCLCLMLLIFVCVCVCVCVVHVVAYRCSHARLCPSVFRLPAQLLHHLLAADAHELPRELLLVVLRSMRDSMRAI